MVVRTPTTVVGSGIIDILGEAYIKNKARKDKQHAVYANLLANARKPNDAKTAVVASAPAPVVGNGRRGRPKGSKNKVKKGGNILKDIGKTIGKTVDVINSFAYLHKELKKIKV